MFLYLSYFFLSNIEEKFLDEINNYRIKNKLIPFISNKNLQDSARKQSLFQKSERKCTHFGQPQNKFFYERIKNSGYFTSECGENVAQGYGKDYKAIINMLKKSQPHNRHLLSNRFDETGVACEIDNYDNKSYWTQVFGISKVKDSAINCINNSNNIIELYIANEKQVEQEVSLEAQIENISEKNKNM